MNIIEPEVEQYKELLESERRVVFRRDAMIKRLEDDMEHIKQETPGAYQWLVNINAKIARLENVVDAARSILHVASLRKQGHQFPALVYALKVLDDKEQA